MRAAGQDRGDETALEGFRSQAIPSALSLTHRRLLAGQLRIFLTYVVYDAIYGQPVIPRLPVGAFYQHALYGALGRASAKVNRFTFIIIYSLIP